MDPRPKTAQEYLESAEAAARLDQARAALEALVLPPEPPPPPTPAAEAEARRAKVVDALTTLDPGPLPSLTELERSVMRWADDWTDWALYVRGDVVAYEGASYVALGPAPHTPPPLTPSVWEPLATRGPRGHRGPEGERGPRGYSGQVGSPGGPGLKGDKGDKGDPGDSGTGGATFVVPSVHLGTAAVEGVAASVIRSDSTIVAFDATAPTTQAFGDAAATGSAAVAAHRDHQHGMPANPVPAFGSPGNSAVGDSATDGVATTLPRSDHKHGREAFGSPAASAVGDVGADGAATTLARSNHVHAREAFGNPSTQAFGDSPANGVATTIPRSDHKHGMPAAPTPDWLNSFLLIGA